MEPSFWPWWLGALGLAASALVHLVLTGRALGVSGAWAKVANYRGERATEAAQREMLADAEIEQALLAATEAQFGTAATGAQFGTAATGAQFGTAATGAQFGTAATAAPASGAEPPRLAAPPLSVDSSALFLACLAVGGAASALLRGNWGTQHDLGPSFTGLWGDGIAGLAVLLVGGVLVGFGTRLSGGCTSGHGLMGCSRLQVPSLVATGTFLATAVAFSLLLDHVGLR